MVLSFTEMGKTMGGRVCRSQGLGEIGAHFRHDKFKISVKYASGNGELAVR